MGIESCHPPRTPVMALVPPGPEVTQTAATFPVSLAYPSAAMATQIRYHLEKAWYLCNNGRKGPVWLDIPLDVQAAVVEDQELRTFVPGEETVQSMNGMEMMHLHEEPSYDVRLTGQILERIREAQRPVLLAGTGVRL